MIWNELEPAWRQVALLNYQPLYSLEQIVIATNL